MDNILYYTDLRNRIKAYCKMFDLTITQFARQAGLPNKGVLQFMRGDSPTCKVETAQIYEAALLQIANVECEVCHNRLGLSHFCVKPGQRDGECLACYKKRICATNKANRAKGLAKQRAHKPTLAPEPIPSYKGREQSPDAVIQPSTIAGVDVSLLWARELMTSKPSFAPIGR